jgi:hypothetical protein
MLHRDRGCRGHHVHWQRGCPQRPLLVQLRRWRNRRHLVKLWGRTRIPQAFRGRRARRRVVGKQVFYRHIGPRQLHIRRVHHLFPDGRFPRHADSLSAMKGLPPTCPSRTPRWRAAGVFGLWQFVSGKINYVVIRRSLWSGMQCLQPRWQNNRRQHQQSFNSPCHRQVAVGNKPGVGLTGKRARRPRQGGLYRRPELVPGR